MIGGIAFVFYQTFLGMVNSTMHYPWLIGIFLVACGSVLPDKLEPAYTRNHRGICHSRDVRSLMTILFVILALLISVAPAFPQRIPLYLASCFFLGYLFHLLADSMTPAGLPH